MKTTSLILWLFCLSQTVIANSALSENASAAVTQYQYELLAERNHKSSLFTQGFLLKDQTFYESSGLYGRSLLVSYPRAEPASRWAQMTAPFSNKDVLPDQYFAEGLALLDDKLYLLTWQAGTVLVYERAGFTLKQQLHYSGEGWGLTEDGEQLIRSDGTNKLYFHNPDNFAVTRTITVTEHTHPVDNLNELEYVKQTIWANVWHENRLVQIDPRSGRVIGSLDLTELAAGVDEKTSESVLNGIAYDADKDALWVTGKNWPDMYLIKIKTTQTHQPDAP